MSFSIYIETHPSVNSGGLWMVGLQVADYRWLFFSIFFLCFPNFPLWSHNAFNVFKGYFDKCCRVACWWPRVTEGHLLESHVLMVWLCPSPGPVCSGGPRLRAALREPAGLLCLSVLQWLHPGRGRETVCGWVSHPALLDGEAQEKLVRREVGGPRIQLLSFEFQQSAPSSLA